jgi:hypothetical protein
MDGFGKTTHANAMAADSIHSSHSRYVAVPRNVVRIRALGFTLDVEGFHAPRNRTYDHYWGCSFCSVSWLFLAIAAVTSSAFQFLVAHRLTITFPDSLRLVFV